MRPERHSCGDEQSFFFGGARKPTVLYRDDQLFPTAVNSPSNNTIYTVPIVGTGTGPGGSAASTHPHDFDKERVSQVHLLQLLAFTNQHPVQSLRGSSQSHFQDVEHHAEID